MSCDCQHDILIGAIKKLTVEPGDTIIVKVKPKLTSTDYEAIKHRVEEVLAHVCEDVEFIIMDSDMDIEVIRPKEQQIG